MKSRVVPQPRRPPPVAAQQAMADKAEVWERLVEKHGLQARTLRVSACLVLFLSSFRAATALVQGAALKTCSLRPPCRRTPQPIPYEKLATWNFADFVWGFPGGMLVPYGWALHRCSVTAPLSPKPVPSRCRLVQQREQAAAHRVPCHVHRQVGLAMLSRLPAPGAGQLQQLSLV